MDAIEFKVPTKMPDGKESTSQNIKIKKQKKTGNTFEEQDDYLITVFTVLL